MTPLRSPGSGTTACYVREENVTGILNIDRDGAVAKLELNRPDAFNALNAALRGELRLAISKLEMDETVRVVVLSGAGRGFCAGADLTERPSEPVHMMIEEEYRPILTGIAGSSKIWIAQVHGSAAGIGAAIAMNCDMMTIESDATIYMAFAAIGLVPDGGNCWLLSRAMGYRQALQAILQGRKIAAQEALDYGLANAVHPSETLQTETLALARNIAAGPPLATAAAKRLLRRMDGLSFGEAISAEALEQTPLIRSADCTEGVSAFLEKRKPDFTGN